MVNAFKTFYSFHSNRPLPSLQQTCRTTAVTLLNRNVVTLAQKNTPLTLFDKVKIINMVEDKQKIGVTPCYSKMTTMLTMSYHS